MKALYRFGTPAIVRRMKKGVLLLLVLLVSTPLLAQESEFGILVGAAKRTSVSTEGIEPFGDALSLDNSTVELFYATPLDPVTYFKIKAGRISAPGAFRTEAGDADFAEADVEHVDGLIEYRFSEPFGSAGIFAGAGLYRQRAERTNGDEVSETDFGFSAGVNGDFPLTRSLGVVLEVGYHWVQFETRPRYLTVGGGIRISF